MISAKEYALKNGLAEPAFAFNLPALLITWVITAILIKGIKEAASTNNIIVVVKIAVVLFVICVGAFYINTDNWVPFIPEKTTNTGCCRCSDGWLYFWIWRCVNCCNYCVLCLYWL
jgi:APA family basic amino acid/polyamine antiporter